MPKFSASQNQKKCTDKMNFLTVSGEQKKPVKNAGQFCEKRTQKTKKTTCAIFATQALKKFLHPPECRFFAVRRSEFPNIQNQICICCLWTAIFKAQN